MKTLKVPIYLTFANWLIIVIIGSLLCPYVGEAITNRGFAGGSNASEKTLQISLMCMAISAVCSLPALIIMFLTHLFLNKGNVSKKKHMLIQNAVHLGVSVLTFGVLYSMSGIGREADFIVILVVSYVPVAIIVWNITYAFQKEKTTQVARSGTDVLDEF